MNVAFGSYQNIKCIVPLKEKGEIFLYCPLSKGFCLLDCSSQVAKAKDINCHIDYDKTKKIVSYTFKAKKEHVGIWKCQQNIKNSKSITLNFKEKPDITNLSILPTPIINKRKATVTCSFELHPDNDVEVSLTTINNNGIVTAVLKLDKFNETTVKSTFTVDYQKQKLVECCVSRKFFSRKCKRNSLNIIYLPKAVSVKFISSETPLTIGKRIKVECLVSTGNPIPKYRLFITRENNETKNLETESWIIQKKDNNARISCEVYNDLMRNMVSSFRMLTFLYPPKNIQLSVNPSAIVKEGSNVNIICRTNSGSNPTTKLLWIITDKNGKKLNLSNIEKFDEVSKKMYGEKLTVASIKYTANRNANGAKIMCKGVYLNRDIFVKSETLKVLYLPKNLAIIKYGNVVKETDSLILKCKVSESNPTVSLMWSITYKNKVIDITKYSTITKTEGRYNGVKLTSRLNFPNITRTFHGSKIVCKTFDKSNQEILSENYIINVSYPTTVDVKISSHTALTGKPFELYCQLNQGNEKFTVKQLKVYQCHLNFASTYNYDFSSCNMVKHNNWHVQFSKLNRDNAGRYYCVFYNSNSELVTGTYLLDVKYPPLFTEKKKKIQANENENIKIIKYYSANPVVTKIEWYYLKDNKNSLDNWLQNSFPSIDKFTKLASIGRYVLNKYSNISTLTISNLMPDDFGLYVCRITNKFGDVLSYNWLISTESFIIPFHSLSAVRTVNGVRINFQPPHIGHYSYIILTVCRKSFCKIEEIRNPQIGIHIYNGELSKEDDIRFSITVYQKSQIVFSTKSFYINRENEFKMTNAQMMTVIFGSIIIIIAILLVIMILYVKKIMISKRNSKLSENMLRLRENSIYYSMLNNKLNYPRSMIDIPLTKNSIYNQSLAESGYTKCEYPSINDYNGETQSQQVQYLPPQTFGKKYLESPNNTNDRKELIGLTEQYDTLSKTNSVNSAYSNLNQFICPPLNDPTQND